MIAFDLETDRMRRAVAAPAPVCVQWTEDGVTPHLALINDQLSTIRQWLVNTDLTLVGHNVSYDFCCLMAYEPDLIPLVFEAYDQGRVEDTLLNQKLIDIATGRLRHIKKTKGYDLGSVAERYEIQVDKTDPWRLRYGELRDLPIELWPPSAREYCYGDALAPWKVWHKQRELDAAWTARMGSPLFGAEPAFQARAALALQLATVWGVRSDPDKCAELAAKTERYLVRARSRLVRAGIVRPAHGEKGPRPHARTDVPKTKPGKAGSKDTRVMQAIVLNKWRKKGLTPVLTDGGEKAAKLAREAGIPFTPEGAHICLDADAAEQLGDPLLDLYRDYTGQDAINKKVNALRAGAVLPLQASFDPLLVTGRTSSYQPREDGDLVGMQLQNFHRKFGVRECLIPRAGHCFISIDYNSAELHTLAQCLLDLFKYSRLAELLNKGLDVHLWFAAQMLGITYEQAYARRKEPLIKEMRQRAKPANFGFPGGMGAAKFVIYARGYGVILTIDQARALRDSWLAAFPEMQLYFDWMSSKLEGRDTCLIQQIRCGRWRGACYYTDGCNTQFQGLQAQASKAALWEVSKRCYSVKASPLYGARPWNHVHDENLIEALLDRAHDAAWEGTRVMVDKFNEYVPDVPVKAEPALMLRWYKDAERVEDSNGRLIPWEPQRKAA